MQKHLFRALTELFKRYGGKGKVYCTITANVILEHEIEKTFQVFFGQTFKAGQKSINYGVMWDDYGEPTNDGMIFTLSTPKDASSLPVSFTPNDFAEIFYYNFSNSAVKVKSIINFVYKFTKVMKNYEKDKVFGQKPQRLF